MSLLTEEKLKAHLSAQLGPETVDELLSLAEPCLRLATHDSFAAEASGLGGSPLMPPDSEWPEWKGRPLSFLGQLRLEDLAQQPELAGIPGALLFFYDADQQESWGFDPADAGA